MLHLLRKPHQEIQLERIHMRTQLALPLVPHTVRLACAETEKCAEMRCE